MLHIAAGVLLPDTPPAAEALLVEDLTETLADMLLPSSSTNGARHDPSL